MGWTIFKVDDGSGHERFLVWSSVVDAPITYFLYDHISRQGRLVHGRVLAVYPSRFTANTDETLKTVLFNEDEEGNGYVRGHHAEDSAPVRAMLVANVLKRSAAL